MLFFCRLCDADGIAAAASAREARKTKTIPMYFALVCSAHGENAMGEGKKNLKTFILHL